jgi:hypothetical protein
MLPMSQPVFFIIVLVFAGVTAAALLLYAARLRPRTRQRPIWHYVLVWPLILERGKRNQDSRGSALSTRETLGWIAVVLLIVTALVFNL